MKQIESFDFNNPKLLKSYIYLKQSIKEGEKLYIGILDNIDSDILVHNIISISYKLKQGFFFFIPSNNNLKGYCYDAKNTISINKYKDELFILSDREYLDTFRAFIKNDGILKPQLDHQLIKTI